MTQDSSVPPVAKRIPHRHELHGDVREDPYHWLRDRDDGDTVAYLEAENAYLTAHGPSAELQERLYAEMFGRLKQNDLSVPVQDGPYWYYSRLVEGGQHPVHCRKRASTRAELEAAPEEVLLDVNALAEGHAFFKVSVMQVSNDHQWLAYSVDTDGSSNNTFHFKHLATGEHLPETIPNTESYASLVWAADNKTVFYLVMDDTHRPFELRRHRLGTSVASDAVLYREEDETFNLWLGRSSDRQYLFLNAAAKITNEVRLLRSSDPDGEWRVFAPRVRGVEYGLEHSRDQFLVITNEGATNFKLMGAPAANSSEANARREAWRTLIAHRDDALIEGVLPLRDHLVIGGRADGLPCVWVADPGCENPRRIRLGNDGGGVYIGDQREFDSHTCRLGYDAWTTPHTVLELDLKSLEPTVLKRDEVEGGYDETAFEARREWATARDGTRVPVSLVAKRGVLGAGPAPTLLYAYGSYGLASDPGFSRNLLSLLERGVVYATAHVRGGNEMGRTWYERGKLMHKRNTFTDFIDCAEHLIASGVTTSDRLAANGGSAGGLLMGAVANMRPDLFRAVVSEVPFVDVMTTMLDASIPLTASEWDEWGDPREAEAYAYMRSYSPYDNVTAQAYPHLLVTTGLNDPRVAFWEPAKYVARLREVKTDGNDLFLYTNLNAGHGGAAGRFDRLREIALKFAFVLERIAPGTA